MKTFIVFCQLTTRTLSVDHYMYHYMYFWLMAELKEGVHFPVSLVAHLPGATPCLPSHSEICCKNGEGSMGTGSGAWERGVEHGNWEGSMGMGRGAWKRGGEHGNGSRALPMLWSLQSVVRAYWIVSCSPLQCSVNHTDKVWLSGYKCQESGSHTCTVCTASWSGGLGMRLVLSLVENCLSYSMSCSFYTSPTLHNIMHKKKKKCTRPTTVVKVKV